jgi:FkbM family methyltransferase
VGRTELDVLYEVALKGEYQLPPDVEPATIVDLGAHVGLATLYFAAHYPRARVVAVEADPELIPRLAQNAPGAEIVHAAIGRIDGVRTFYRADDTTWGNSVDRTLPWQTPVTVPAMTLEGVLDRRGIERVDLLKVDIEGAEWEVFANGVPDRVNAIIGELHFHAGRHPRELLERIAESMIVHEGRSDDKRIVFRAARR